MNTQAILSDIAQPAGTRSCAEEGTAASAAPAGLPPVTVLGLGMTPPHSWEDLPAASRALLAEADTLAGGDRWLNALPAGPQERIRLISPLEDALQRIQHCHTAGRRVLVLADGDPLYFGIGATLVRRMGAEHIRIVPQVSSLQTACARLGLPWHTVRSCSLHGRGDWRPLLAGIRAGAPVCVLTDAQNSPDVIARHLLDRGVDWLRMALCERMGAPDERISFLSLEKAAQCAHGTPCTVLLVPERPPRLPHMGLDAALLARHADLMTKRPVRAAALALLRVLPQHTVWDIGSGSGAVALEAAALAWEGRVCAVERNPMRAIDIQTNRRRTGAANVQVCCGAAPQCLAALPAPDGIFLGGGLSGGAEQATALLDALASRLPAGGRLVMACVLMGSLHTALRFFTERDWPVELECVQAAHARPLAGDLHMSAYNPVYLLAVSKPALAD